MKKCCNKSLFREGSKFCSECGIRLHRTLAEKEILFFQVSNLLDQFEAAEFVEDYDQFGNLALNWHGLVVL